MGECSLGTKDDIGVLLAGHRATHEVDGGELGVIDGEPVDGGVIDHHGSRDITVIHCRLVGFIALAAAG